jgi:hypothetical protein
MNWLLVALAAAELASCRASYSSTTKEETRADGTSSKETTTEMSGELFPNGGSVTTDGKSVEVKVEGPNGTTTENPAPGEPVPVPEGSTSVEVKEKVPPPCPCRHLRQVWVAGGGLSGHNHRTYHRFERYVAVGGWEAFLYAEDSSAWVDGEDAARGHWQALVASLGTLSPAPAAPGELGDVRFYAMRASYDNGQLYLSFADITPFDSLSVVIAEVGTSNAATYDLGSPGATQSSANGWHFATIPIDFIPANGTNPTIEVLPSIQSAGASHAKGYIRTFAWE